MEKELELKLQMLCEMEKSIISCTKTEIDNGVMNADTAELGQVVDIIKDLAEAEKYLRESSYYNKVVEAMEKSDEEPYDERMGYRPRMSGNIHYGYRPMVDQEPYISDYINRKGYSEYGTPYTEYMDARKHYTKTKSADDKAMMDMHAREHMTQTIETIEDIWEDATPELKQKMKSELKRLMESMTV